MLAPWKKSSDKTRQHIIKQRHYFADKDPSSQSYGFSSSHLRMWELDNQEGWVPKNWCFWTVLLEKTLESSLGCKEIKAVNPKGNQSWIFIGRIDAEAPIFWPLDMKNWLIEKDPDDGKDWTQEEKGMTEDKMVVWHHQLNGHESSKLQEMMKDREPWGCKESDMTEWLNNNWGFFFQTFIQLKRLSFPNGIGAFAKNCVCESWLLLHWSICLSLRSYSCLDFFFPPDLPSFPHASSPKRTLLINCLANIPITGSIFRELDLRLQQTRMLIVKWETSGC